MSGGTSFERFLNLPAAAALVVGTVVGSGIFLTTGIVAESVPSPGWILAVWLLGGAIAATGALTFAQLAALRPEAGGAYVYLREAYGPGMGFVYGWALFLVLQTGSIAAIALGFAHYFGRFVPALSMERVLADFGGWTIRGGQFSAAGAIALLTLLNVRGARLGSGAQVLLAALKVGTLAALAAGGWWVSRSPSPVFASSSWTPTPSAPAFGVALIAVLWSYAGWWNLNFVAEETRRPERNIPLAMALGMTLVAGLYLAVNWVYVFAAPLDTVRGVVPVAERAAEYLFGESAPPLIAFAVALSALGALNGLILASPRAYFAMARQGDFLSLPARLHPRFGTPHLFLLAQGAWGVVLAFTGGYEALFTCVMFPGFLFTALACAALFILRRRCASEGGQAPLPMRALYPWLPAIHIAASLALAVNTLYERPKESLAGAALIAAAGIAFSVRGLSRARENSCRSDRR